MGGAIRRCFFVLGDRQVVDGAEMILINCHALVGVLSFDLGICSAVESQLGACLAVEGRAIRKGAALGF